MYLHHHYLLLQLRQGEYSWTADSNHSSNPPNASFPLLTKFSISSLFPNQLSSPEELMAELNLAYKTLFDSDNIKKPINLVWPTWWKSSCLSILTTASPCEERRGHEGVCCPSLVIPGASTHAGSHQDSRISCPALCLLSPLLLIPTSHVKRTFKNVKWHTRAIKCFTCQ